MPFASAIPSDCDEFIARNAAVWRYYDQALPAETDHYITVDLAHDHVSYLHTNLVVAKLIQYALRAKGVVGVWKSWPGVLGSDDYATRQRFAESFGVTQIADLDLQCEQDAEGRLMAKQALAVVNAPAGRDWRDALCDLEVDGHVCFGLSVYDTLIRTLRTASVTPDHGLMASLIGDSALSMARIRCHFGAIQIAAHVTGHVHYVPYSAISSYALSQGAPVFYQNLLRPVSLLRLDTPSELLAGRPDSFAEWLSKVFRHATTSSLGYGLYCSNPRGFARNGREDLSNEGSEPVVVSTGRPTIVLLAHALTDDVHAYGRYFYRDFADWLESSLETCAEVDTVDVLVKPHPRNQDYDTDGCFATLAARYRGHKTIRFLDERPIDWQASSISFAVTVHGAPGFEIPTLGLPVVSLARFDGLGFARRPKSRMEYEEWLRNPALVPGLTNNEHASALRYGFYDWFGGRARCNLLPGLRQESNSYFKLASEALANYTVEADELNGAIEHMVQTKAPSLLNPSLVGRM
jgi:hypothetical protein